MTLNRKREARRLIDSLRSAGARLSAEGETLSVAAPKGAICPETAGAIRTLKPELLSILKTADAIERVDRGKPLRMGLVQERMWAHDQFEPEALVHNLPAAWRFTGPFDAGAFIGAFADFAQRHEVMRMRIDLSGGTPLQVFLDRPSRGLEFETIEGADAEEREARLEERIEAIRTHQFNLSIDDPYVGRLFRLGEQEHVFFYMPHHVIWDGWCFDIFLRELREFYEARTENRAANLPPQAIQYADYAAWHRRRADEGAYDDALDYWGGVLKDSPPPPRLPEDLVRPALYRSTGDRLKFEFGEATLAGVRRLAKDARATTSMVFHCLWRAFLARITGDADIVIGTPIQAREHADAADLIGCFVNMILLRHRIDCGKTIAELIEETREKSVEAYGHQEASLELLIERYAGRRDASRTPLYQTLFIHQQVSRRPGNFGKASVTQVHVNPRAAQTDIAFGVMEGTSTALGVLHFASGVFSAEQGRNIERALLAFIESAIANPTTPVSLLSLMSEEDRARLEAHWRSADASFDLSARAPDLIDRAASRAPERIAISTSRGSITYADLMARIARLAGWLQANGVAPGDIVGLSLPRDADMVMLAIAVWRCGAAYLPLDPAFPEERLAYMMEDSGAKLFVSTSDIGVLQTSMGARRLNVDEAQGEIANHPPAFDFKPTPGESERAYVLYTSGSTGKPKGVANSHGALSNFLQAMLAEPGFGAGDRLLAVTTLSFDISILELFVPLIAGGEVVIATAEEAVDGEALKAMIARHRPTMMQATPSSWRLLLDSGFAGAPSLRALCGGEPLPPALAESLLQRVDELWNMYGPTETTVWSTCKRIERAGRITIGGPIANTRLYIVDAGGELLPDGMAGELWIGGDGVAIGYLNRRELTAERFIRDPFRQDGGRVYRTGDLARRLAGGEIEHLGRIDSQVKLRGFRIELGEIESALEAHEAVARAVAAVKKDASGEPVLTAYILYKDGMSATGSDLRRFLRGSLPQYMLPQFFVEISRVPLTGSGKADRNALPDPVGGSGPKRARTPARTPDEQKISALWRDILKSDDISVTDNFFELGGNSLQAAQMAARFRAETGKRLVPRSIIFESLEQLAAGLERGAR